MADEDQKIEARAAAEEYAPAPIISSLLYGVIAAVLAGMALWVVGLFYGVNFLLNPIPVSLALATAFAGGIILRLVRKRRNRAAYGAEYDKRNAPSE